MTSLSYGLRETLDAHPPIDGGFDGWSRARTLRRLLNPPQRLPWWRRWLWTREEVPCLT